MTKRYSFFALLLIQSVWLWAQQQGATGKDEGTRTDSDYGTMTLIAISGLLILGILLVATWRINKSKY